MISLRYALTHDDFVNFSVYVQLEAPGKKKALLRRFSPVLILFCLVCVINVVRSVMLGEVNFGDFIALGVFILILLLPLLSMKTRIRKQALKFAVNPENAAIFTIADHVFSDSGVFYKDAVKETHFNGMHL